MQILSASHFLVPPSYSARLHQPVNTLQHPTHLHASRIPGISTPQEAPPQPGLPFPGPMERKFSLSSQDTIIPSPRYARVYSVHFWTHILWLAWGYMSIKLNNTFLLTLESWKKIWCSHIWRKTMCSLSNVRRNDAKLIIREWQASTRRFLHLRIKHCDFTKLWIRHEIYGDSSLHLFPQTHKNKAFIVYALLHHNTAS